MLENFKKDAAERMEKCVTAFRNDLKKLRTGRAQPSLVEHLKVEYYGNEVPLMQVANINVEDARTLAVTPWDRNMVPVIEKAIIKSDLGLTPATAGQVIRIPLPALTEERRRELTKVVTCGSRERARRRAQRAPRRHERAQGDAEEEAPVAG